MTILFFYCCLSNNGQQLSQSSFFSFLFPPSLRYNITHSTNLEFYLGITHLKKNIISSFMFQERPLSLKLIFHYYNQINRQRDKILWMRDVLTNFFLFSFFFLFHFTVFVAGLFLFLVFFFFLFFFFFFSSSTLPSSILFFSFRVSLFIFLLLVCSFFFFFTSFNSSIFLSPFRWCRVVMLKTVVYGNQVHSESLKNSTGTGTKSHMLYTHIINMLIYTCTCSCSIITTQ